MKKFLSLILFAALFFSCKKTKITAPNSLLVGRWYYTADTLTALQYGANGTLIQTINLNPHRAFNNTDFLQFNNNSTCTIFVNTPVYTVNYTLNSGMISFPEFLQGETTTIETLTETKLKLLSVSQAGAGPYTGDYLTTTEVSYFTRGNSNGPNPSTPSIINNPGLSSITVSTLAGNGHTGSANGTGATASFNDLAGVAVDANGNVYVADSRNNQVREVSPAGVVSTFAGGSVAGSTNGTRSTALFNGPAGVAVDNAGNVYVADEENNMIRKINTSGVVTTLAGSGVAGATNGTGTQASFNSPIGVAVDADGNVYVADIGNTAVRRISPAGVVTTFAGTGASGIGSITPFNYPIYAAAVAVDAAGNVYVADGSNCLIDKISQAGAVTAFAGSALSGSANGTGLAASFNNPSGVAVDAAGNVYVGDALNNKIREINPAGVVITLAGTGVQGSANGSGAVASFFFPGGVAVDANGNVYVSDGGDNRVRKLTH